MIEFNDSRRIALGSEYKQYFHKLEEIADYLSTYIEPYAHYYDRDKKFCPDIFRNLARLVIPISFPKHYCGLNMPLPVYIAAIEMASEADASHGLSVAIDVTANKGILKFGNEAQRQRYLPDLLLGHQISAFALTEPNAGSDTSSIRTKAELKSHECGIWHFEAQEKDDGFVVKRWSITGEKIFISNTGIADIYYLVARTEKGISNFIVERDPAFVKAHIDKLGLHASPTGILSFNAHEIPKENLVGKEGEGHHYFTSMLFEGRISIGAFALGIANGYYNKFVRAIKDNHSEADVHKLAKMATMLNSARSLVYNVAKDIESMAYQEQANYSAQAKIAATEAGLFVCNVDLPLNMEEKDRLSCERHFRDIRLSSIGEGTTEILEFVTGKLCLKK